MGWSALARHVGNLTWSTAAAILVAQLSPVNPQRHVPLCSELLCWILVALWAPAARFFRCGVPKGFATTPVPLRWLFWLAAASIAFTALCSSATEFSWLIVSIV